MYSIRETAPKKIVILRALQFGDLMCAIPAFRALRTAAPTSQISLVGLSWSRNFIQRFKKYLDEFIEFPGYPGFPEITPRIQEIPRFLQNLQERNFDLCLQMQGSGYISNSLSVLFGAKENAGFYLPGQYCPDAASFLPYPVHEPEVIRHIQLMDFLGIPAQGTHLEFPIEEAEWQRQRELLSIFNLIPGEFICIHPGARDPKRRWAPKKFAAVADGLSKLGFKIILTGSSEESEITANVAELMENSSVDLAGKTSVGVMGAVLADSRMLICNDTGVSHLAAALKIPSIVLFLASEVSRWAPLDTTFHRVIPWAVDINPQSVIVEAEKLLREEPHYVA